MSDKSLTLPSLMLIGWGALVERAPHPLLISRACLRILSLWSSLLTHPCEYLVLTKNGVWKNKSTWHYHHHFSESMSHLHCKGKDGSRVHTNPSMNYLVAKAPKWVGHFQVAKGRAISYHNPCASLIRRLVRSDGL